MGSILADVFNARLTVTLKRFRCGRTDGEIMFGRFRKEKEATGRICPLCELENPIDASSCSQCYFQLEKNNRQQNEAMSDDEENVLLDELLNAEMEIEEDETVPVDVITMDEMTVEVDQYQDATQNDEAEHEFTFIKSTGPTFSEIKVDGDGHIESQSTPTLASMPGVAVEQNVNYEGEVAEEIEVDESEDDVDLLSLPQLPQIIAPQTIVRDESGYVNSVNEVESTSIASVTPDVSHTEETVPIPEVVADVNVGLPALPVLDSEIAPEVVSEAILQPDPIPETVPTPENVDDVSVELPRLPDIVADVATDSPVAIPATPTLASSTTPSAAPPAAAFSNSNNGHIWPWPPSDSWDYRDLYRELKEAMEAGQRGDHTTAATSLDRLGPHLGERVDMLYYVGQVLIILGRQEELNSMLSSAKKAHPDDQQVSTAVYHLGMMGQNNASDS